MSITYPESQPSATSRRAIGAAIMNSGSALFPTGAAGVYERAAKARTSRNMPLAWVAVPAAVILAGGAAYLSIGHHQPARPAPAARVSSITVTPTAPASIAAPPSPKVGQTPAPATITHRVRTSVQRTTTQAAPPVHAVRSTSVTRQTVTAQAPVALIPTLAAPAAVAAPTPGTFAFTPAPTAIAPSATSDAVTPPAAATSAPSSDVQPAPQA